MFCFYELQTSSSLTLHPDITVKHQVSSLSLCLYVCLSLSLCLFCRCESLSLSLSLTLSVSPSFPLFSRAHFLCPVQGMCRICLNLLQSTKAVYSFLPVPWRTEPFSRAEAYLVAGRDRPCLTGSGVGSRLNERDAVQVKCHRLCPLHPTTSTPTPFPLLS